MSKEMLEEYANQMAQEYHVPGYAIGYFKANETPTFLYGGFADMEFNQKVTNKTRFPFSCCTKSFTSITAKKIGIQPDRPLRSYTEDINFGDSYVNEHMTVTDLLTHRSGIAPNMLWTCIMQEHDINEVLSYLPKLCRQGFREKYSYSNLTYSVIGSIMEKVAGDDYVQCMKDILLKPLGLSEVDFYSKDTRSNEQKIDAKPYDYFANELKRIVQTNLHILNPASGMIVTIDEAITLTQMILSLSKDRAYKEIFEPIMISEKQRLYREMSIQHYTRGLYSQNLYGHDLYYHNGYIVGYSSYMCVLPEYNAGIVVLSNCDKTVFPKVVAYQWMESLFGMATDGKWSHRLKREQILMRQAEYAFHKQVENSEKSDKIQYKNLKIDSMGLRGQLILGEKNQLSLNGCEFELEQLNERVYYTFYKDTNDYLIVELGDEVIQFCGTVLIDKIECPYTTEG